MAILDNRLRLAFDLLEDGEVVHVSGPEGGVIFGSVAKPGDLWKGDEYKKKMEDLSRHLNDRDHLRDDIKGLGELVFSSLINLDKHILGIYNNYIGHAGARPQDLSISFRMDSKYLDFPIEFMRDVSNIPVGARIPVFKTLTTKELYGKRKDLNTKDKLKVLLISSNTHLSEEQEIVMGNDRVGLGIELDSVPQLDEPRTQLGEPRSEIDNITDILRQSRNNEGPNVEVTPLPTTEINFSKFIELLESDEFDIIHYNGHGYLNADEPDKSFICFWEKKNGEGDVVAVTANDLYSALRYNKQKLKLFYLSCCEGGGVGNSYKRLSNNFLGLVEPIINAGVPNVIAMRWPISVNNSKSLAVNFYRALFSGDDAFGTIESAMSRARGQALGFPDPSAWCSPILVKQDF